MVSSYPKPSVGYTADNWLKTIVINHFLTGIIIQVGKETTMQQEHSWLLLGYCGISEILMENCLRLGTIVVLC